MDKETFQVRNILVFLYLFWREKLFLSPKFFAIFFQAEDGIRDLVRSRGLGDVYKRQMPAENAAMASGGHPKDWTYKNIKVMKSQMRPMGWTLDLSLIHI